MDKKLGKKKFGKTNHADPVAELLGEILAPNTDDGIGTDNMTCILITLNNDNIAWDVSWSKQINWLHNLNRSNIHSELDLLSNFYLDFLKSLANLIH